MREKREGTVLLPLIPHLCLKVAPCSSYRESPVYHFHMLVGFFHYRTWLVYFDDGLPITPRKKLTLFLISKIWPEIKF